MKYRVSVIVLIVTLLVLSFSFVFLCNAIENTDDFKTEKIGIVVKKENISDSNWWVDYNSLGIDSIQKIIPVLECKCCIMCGCSLVVKLRLPKPAMWVRFPSPAPCNKSNKPA